jgi:hypothetical protein
MEQNPEGDVVVKRVTKREVRGAKSHLRTSGLRNEIDKAQYSLECCCCLPTVIVVIVTIITSKYCSFVVRCTKVSSDVRGSHERIETVYHTHVVGKERRRSGGLPSISRGSWDVVV